MSEQNVPVSHSQIIDREGGPARFAARLGEEANNVKGWKRGNSIPAGYWRKIVTEGLASYSELSAWAEHRKLAADEAKAADEAA